MSPDSTRTPAHRPGKGMQLGGKAKTNDFVEALIAEGESVMPDHAVSPAAAGSAPAGVAGAAVRGGSAHSLVETKRWGRGSKSSTSHTLTHTHNTLSHTACM